MGRPREHDERTGIALLDAAERIIAAHGLSSLSVRALAEEVGTTTRAIYSVFGSKDALIVALGARTFDLLASTVQALPVTADPAADLIEAGVSGFRRLVVEHPALFRLGIQQNATTEAQMRAMPPAVERAWTVLLTRVRRLQDGPEVSEQSHHDTATAFHALCEGLAALEIRGVLPAPMAEQQWRSSLTALVHGLSITSVTVPALDQQVVVTTGSTTGHGATRGH